LFFRISVATLHISPLRERRQDILPLAYHFLERFSKEMGSVFQLTSRAEKALEAYDYPGNARDLRNTIERACIFCDDTTITPEDLGLPAGSSGSEAPAVMTDTLNLAEVERALIERALHEHPDNHSAAARSL